jgi:hypothetical protein
VSSQAKGNWFEAGQTQHVDGTGFIAAGDAV